MLGGGTRVFDSLHVDGKPRSTHMDAKTANGVPKDRVNHSAIVEDTCGLRSELTCANGAGPDVSSPYDIDGCKHSA